MRQWLSGWFSRRVDEAVAAADVLLMTGDPAWPSAVAAKDYDWRNSPFDWSNPKYHVRPSLPVHPCWATVAECGHWMEGKHGP